MSFTTIPSTDLEVGKPTKKSLFTTIKNNEDDHETRLNNLEAGAGKVNIFSFQIIGYVSNYSVAELKALGNFLVPAGCTLQELCITVIDSTNTFDSSGNVAETSSAGELEIDLLKSTDGGATFASVLTTKPSIPDGKNGKGTSSNSIGCTPVIFSNNSLNQDDILQVDLNSKKDEQGSFLITCYATLD